LGGCSLRQPALQRGGSGCCHAVTHFRPRLCTRTYAHCVQLLDKLMWVLQGCCAAALAYSGRPPLILCPTTHDTRAFACLLMLPPVHATKRAPPLERPPHGLEWCCSSTSHDPSHSIQPAPVFSALRPGLPLPATQVRHAVHFWPILATRLPILACLFHLCGLFVLCMPLHIAGVCPTIVTASSQHAAWWSVSACAPRAGMRPHAPCIMQRGQCTP
jgi:hypothetical protein